MKLYAQQDTTNNIDKGQLLINIRSLTGEIPIENASVTLSYTGQPDSTLETLSTDNSGQTETVTLDTPPLEYSMQPGQNQPYAEYTIQVSAEGYKPVTVSGIELLPMEEAVQSVTMVP